MRLADLDQKLIGAFRRSFIPCARVALFVVFFWFGILKIIGASPASPLAHALVNKTIGDSLFEVSFFVLALLECVIGVLFLIPRATRLVIPLLLLHMLVVCAPLVLLPSTTWQSFAVPTLEGQYIIKNLVVVALALGVAAHTQPLKSKSA